MDAESSNILSLRDLLHDKMVPEEMRLKLWKVCLLNWAICLILITRYFSEHRRVYAHRRLFLLGILWIISPNCLTWKNSTRFAASAELWPTLSRPNRTSGSSYCRTSSASSHTTSRATCSQPIRPPRSMRPTAGCQCCECSCAWRPPIAGSHIASSLQFSTRTFPGVVSFPSSDKSRAVRNAQCTMQTLPAGAAPTTSVCSLSFVCSFSITTPNSVLSWTRSNLHRIYTFHLSCVPVWTINILSTLSLSLELISFIYTTILIFVA